MHRLPTALLALSLGLAAACGSDDSTGPGAQPTPTPGDVIIVRGASTLTTTAFDPNPKVLALAGAAGVSVRWVNTDGGTGYGGGTAETHQIMSDDGKFGTSQPIPVGSTYSVTLAAGTYHYHCAIHPNMVGTVTVGQ